MGKPKSRPRSTQRAPKARNKSTKKNPKKCCRGKKCLKVAISFWTPNGTHFWSHFLLIFKLIFYIICFTTFKKMLKLILEHSLGSERPKMSPKEPSGASKNQKPSFSKTLKNHLFFKGFWLQRPLKKASRGPRWLPKGTQKIQDPKNKNPKLDPKIITFWNQF